MQDFCLQINTPTFFHVFYGRYAMKKDFVLQYLWIL